MRPQWQSSPKPGTGGIDLRRSGPPPIAIDAGGCGVPVIDDFLTAGIGATVVPILTTSGHQATEHRWADRPAGDPLGVPCWHVPKVEIVGALRSHMDSDRLKFIDDLPFREVLKDELRDYKVTTTQAGNEVFGSKTGAWDDVVSATTFALWLAWKLDNPGVGNTATFAPSPTRGWRGS
jgi:hypothetical protein